MLQSSHGEVVVRVRGVGRGRKEGRKDSLRCVALRGSYQDLEAERTKTLGADVDGDDE